MKRLGRAFDDMLSFENGFVALIKGTEKKRGDKPVQRFLFSEEEVKENATCYHQIDPKRARPWLERLSNDLRSGKWQHEKPYYKQIKSQTRAGKVKVRDIYVPSFRDHIVHHMVIEECKPYFDRGMHPHCCGSVDGRGQGHVVRMGTKWFQRDKQCRYFVQLDIKKFFDSIDPDLLMQAIEKRIKDKYILAIIDQIIHSAPSACPVGYYTSPSFANLFLQDFDRFVEQELYKERRGKRIKYVRHFQRYMDNMLLIGTSKSDLYKAVHAIIDYLRTNLKLEIKQDWEIKRIGVHEIVNGKWKLKKNTYWCDFIGYKFCKDSTILRSGIFISAKRLAKIMYKTGSYTPHQCRSINARVGWASHCDCSRFMEQYIRPFVNMQTTRRIISYVDKNREQRNCEAC